MTSYELDLLTFETFKKGPYPQCGSDHIYELSTEDLSVITQHTFLDSKASKQKMFELINRKIPYAYFTVFGDIPYLAFEGLTVYKCIDLATQELEEDEMTRQDQVTYDVLKKELQLLMNVLSFKNI